ncbi:caspase family protein [Lewinella cohaerens]|uniref:caspase family protein n=1 Tax=Lewinella cohaerens TaxID=70995 RepID=UPI00146E32B8|nr:caspase family protein [Lewinella cohaerens]
MRPFLNIALFFLMLGFTSNLTAQIKADPVVQFGHPGYVIEQIILSPDGEIMATSDGEFLKLWDISSGLELRSYRGNNTGIGGAIFSEDGNKFSYFADGDYYTRSVITGKVLSRVSIEEYMEKNDTGIPNTEDLMEKLSIRYSDDGRLKSELKENEIFITERVSGDKIQTLELPEPELEQAQSNANRNPYLSLFKTMKFSPGNDLFLIDSLLYTIETGEIKYTFQPSDHNILIKNAIFSPDSKVIVFCGTILPSKMEEEEYEQMEEGFSMNALNTMMLNIYQVGKAPGEAVLFVDYNSGTLKADPNVTSVTAAKLSIDGKSLITGHVDKTVKVWNFEEGEEQFTFRLRPLENNQNFDAFGVKSLEQTKDGKYLFIGGSGSIREDQLTMWDFATGEKVKSFGAAIPPINVEARQSSTDSIILQEYEEFLFPVAQLNYRDYGSYRILNLTDGKAPSLFPKFDSIAFSPKLDHYLVKPSKAENIHIYNSLYNEFVTELENSQGTFDYLSFSNNATTVAGSIRGTLFLWNARTGALLHQIDEGNIKLVHLVFEPNDEYLVCTYDPKRIRFYSVASGDIFFEKKPSFIDQATQTVSEGAVVIRDLTASDEESDDSPSLLKRRNPVAARRDRINRQATNVNIVANAADLLIFKEYYDIDISADGTRAAAWRDDLASVEFLNLETKKSTGVIKDKKTVLLNTISGAFGATTEGSQAQDMMKFFFKEKLAFRKYTAISPLWDRVAIATKPIKEEENQNIRVEFVEKMKKREAKELGINQDIYYLNDSEDYAQGIIFSPDGKMIAASSNTLNTIRVWDAYDGSILKTLEGHSGKIAFTSNSKNLISTGWDRQVKVWDLDAVKELYSFVPVQGQNDYVTILPNGYYSTSRKDSRAVAFAYGKEAYPFDQFDVQFNRPDLVLQQLESSIVRGEGQHPNKLLIDAYHRSYLKRLEKLNIEEASFSNTVSLPSITVAEHPLSQSSRNLQLQITATDNAEPLSRLFITVNGVPALAGGSLDIFSPGKRSYSGTQSIELSEGVNRIQAYIMNKSGAISLKYNAEVKYTGASVAKKLHIVTLGTSDFVDSQFNLEYATKDLVDLRSFYGQRTGDFTAVVEHKLEGSNFTLANFRKLQTTLSKTSLDDEVVFFISTHGLLNEDLDYYLATYDVDFSNPTEKGLSYEELESFLQAVRARNKLVFMDACHAGELDDKAMDQAIAAREENGKVNFKAVRSTGWEQLPGQQSFDLMKELFVDLRVGSGATVIASASGVEFAYEGDEWENSAFTYCLINGLKNENADLNNDNQVTISEIQEYLSYAVSRLTNGGQQPINRTENIFNNYVIW